LATRWFDRSSLLDLLKEKEVSMKKFLSLTVLALALASTVAYAGDNPRRQSKEPDGRLNRLSLSAFTLVINPDGPANAPASEALHYLLDHTSIANHVIYGFTSLEGREQFAAKTPVPSFTPKTCTHADARFNKVAYGTGTDWLVYYCGGQKNGRLSDAWNDVISYVEASGSWTILYKCYDFVTSGSCSTLAISGGDTIYDLNTYSFNNYTSGIKVCPEGITFTECQNY
jgi:hypothetical protein